LVGNVFSFLQGSEILKDKYRKRKLNICQKEGRQSQKIKDGSEQAKSITTTGKTSIFFQLQVYFMI
jgi:hypothetical protein